MSSYSTDCSQTYEHTSLTCEEGHELFRYTQLSSEWNAMSSWCVWGKVMSMVTEGGGIRAGRGAGGEMGLL